MNLAFWRKPKINKQKIKDELVGCSAEQRVMRNRLTITMLNGESLEWSNDNWKDKNYLAPWINFYQWYFEKDSDCYVMKYNRGETMFKRADIKSFDVHTSDSNS